MVYKNANYAFKLTALKTSEVHFFHTNAVYTPSQWMANQLYKYQTEQYKGHKKLSFLATITVG